ncbi:MAG: glycoside hydrolase family 2, partial [Bacteroidales bacterium]
MFRKALGSMLCAATCCFAVLCPAFQAAAGESIPLNGKNVWTLSFDGRTIPAAVPGNVELDLLAAGIVDDPTVGNNIYELRRYEGTTWTYDRTFATPNLSEGQRLVLWFGGIDCLAKVYVNGKLVGEPENMFIEHSFDITDFVNATGKADNTLRVEIRSAVLEAQKYDYGAFSVCNFAAPESARIRKAASQFGWDIMPRLVSAGLWRGVELRVLDPSRIKDACWMTLDVDTAAHSASMMATVQTVLPFEEYDNDRIETTLSIDGKTVYKRLQTALYNVTVDRFTLDGVRFWWPLGSGKQPLYTATARLLDAGGKCLDSTSCRIGIRTVKLEMDEMNPEGGTGKFLFRVNGEPIYIRGTNWVPLDACHSRDAAKYEETLALAKDLNCNMIRCWGGNVYEDTRFFDICDSLGIMVWQDFAMGC